MSYYNTTNLAAVPLKDAKQKAYDQDAAVMRAFNQLWQATPSEVWEHCRVSGWLDDGTPLTSVRRSITSLTEKGELTKTDEKRTGIYGRPECVWMVRVVEPTQLRLI